jgi:hypothetical protein
MYGGAFVKRAYCAGRAYRTLRDVSFSFIDLTIFRAASSPFFVFWKYTWENSLLA